MAQPTVDKAPGFYGGKGLSVNRSPADVVVAKIVSPRVGCFVGKNRDGAFHVDLDAPLAPQAIRASGGRTHG